MIYHIVSHCVSNILIWYLIELSRNSGGLRNSWRLLKVPSHSATFFHSLFQIITNMEAFLKVLLFPSGSFHSMGNETGVNCFSWEYSKTLFV